jgi:hypothetical protein
MENFTVHPGSAHSISFPGSAHVPTRLSHLLPDGPRTPATRRPLPCSNRARRQLTRGRDTAYRSGPDPMPAPRRVASSPSNPPSSVFCAPFKRGAARCRRTRFVPISSLPSQRTLSRPTPHRRPLIHASVHASAAPRC